MFGGKHGHASCTMNAPTMPHFCVNRISCLVCYKDEVNLATHTFRDITGFKTVVSIGLIIIVVVIIIIIIIISYIDVVLMLQNVLLSILTMLYKCHMICFSIQCQS